MTKPKDYKIRSNVHVSDLLKSGFVLRGSSYVLKTPLYWFTNDKKTPAIFLVVAVSLNGLNGRPIYISSIVTDDGVTYPPFYNEMQRENNLVYEEVVNNYNSIMDQLIEKNILKRGRRHD